MARWAPVAPCLSGLHPSRDIPADRSSKLHRNMHLARKEKPARVFSSLGREPCSLGQSVLRLNC